MKDAKHYVYMLQCGDGTFYIGYTPDIERRLTMHEKGKGAKYTRGRGPFRLVYKKAFSTKKEAMQAEYLMKKMDRKEKKALAECSMPQKG
ncbi:GIY-YIG nuclease family protein [Alteribacillus sp. YIM 98480]|uniref:GIY-YIG nuclease family protein n=1 Tax=Alteribacillus sp. YIM 98480 TaxID=2606599 RepID=UPI00131D1A97|nr:GIY-YIG nuclease family protein [Alteribacillus sp. YIM 98480]